jgi:hypothetical protein
MYLRRFVEVELEIMVKAVFPSATIITDMAKSRNALHPVESKCSLMSCLSWMESLHAVLMDFLP